MIELLAIQDPPPYVQYIEEAENLGRVGYMSGVCEAAGLVAVNQETKLEIIEDFWRRATIARTEGPMLQAALERGIEREKAAIDLMLDFGPDDGSERRQRREAQATEYIGSGCGDLAVDYPEVFSIPAEAD